MLETNKKHTDVLNEQTKSTKEAGIALDKKEVPLITIMKTVNSQNVNTAILDLFKPSVDDSKSLFTNG